MKKIIKAVLSEGKPLYIIKHKLYTVSENQKIKSKREVILANLEEVIKEMEILSKITFYKL
jgi:hypothetical protein